MSKTTKMVLSILIGVFVLMSLVPYAQKTNPKTDAKLSIKAPDDIMAIFKKSCYDCHSNQTRWPWYSSIFPLSWSISDHVKVGRARLNFDIWQTYSKEKQQKLKDEIFRKTGTIMPLVDYLWFHPDAKLTKEEIKKVRNWASDNKGYVQSEVR
jgi:hypothetical protein